MIVRFTCLFALPVLGALSSCSVSGERGRAPDVVETAGMPPRILYEAAVRGTAAGLITNPVTSTQKGVQMVYRRTREVLPPVVFLPDEVEARPGSAGFERALDRAGIGTVSSGRLDVHVDGAAFFGRLERAIAEAKQSIDWRLFIFDNDDVAVGLADRLKQRSRDGARVRILYDRLGSYLASRAHPVTPYPEGFEQPGSMKSYLQERSRVQVRPQGNPWLVADHTKVLLFDRETAFIGGMNLGREYRSEWHDLMVELQGPVVGVLADDFDRQWGLAGWFGDWTLLDRAETRAASEPGPGEFPMRVIHTAPQRCDIERAHLTAIGAARDSIVIITPYFSSDFVVNALVEAAKRGVEVDVILPEKNNSEIMGKSNWDTARVLMEGGVRVWHHRGSSHMKAARSDSWVCLGSANLDTLSLRINLECNIAFSEPEAVARMNQEVFEKDLRKAKRLRVRDLEGSGSMLAETLADQL